MRLLMVVALVVLLIIVVLLVIRISYINDELELCREQLGDTVTVEHLRVLIDAQDKSLDELERDFEHASQRRRSRYLPSIPESMH